MPTVYPSGYDTETASSLGADKTNKDPIVDQTYDVDAVQWNVVKGGVRQLELMLGDGSGVLTRDGDVDEANVREYMDHMVTRADKALIIEHYLFNNWTTAITEDVGAVAAYAQVSGGIGVAQLATVAGATRGWDQATDHFHQRSSYFRCRWQVDGLGDANGDLYELGLIRDATHYVKFISTRAGGVWPDWTVEVNDGGSTDSAVLTGSAPTASQWHVFEILTTSVGAYFYVDRLGVGGYTEYYEYLNGQAPENGYCHPALYVTLDALSTGGDNINNDLMAFGDTRVL